MRIVFLDMHATTIIYEDFEAYLVNFFYSQPTSLTPVASQSIFGITGETHATQTKPQPG
jgi:hypothetical protein